MEAADFLQVMKERMLADGRDRFVRHGHGPKREIQTGIGAAAVSRGHRDRDAHNDPGEVFADSAYRGNHFGDAVRAKGVTPRIVATGMRGRDEAKTQARLEAWNQPIHGMRGRIEKIFGTWKRSYGPRRMRWRGPGKAGVQIRLTAIAYNMKRSLKVIAIAR
jgi:IS5 family transposase